MKARVKSEHRWKNVTAFGGLEFVKGEYREVPAGFEKEAQAHPFLEVLTGKKVIPAEEVSPVEEIAVVTGEEAEEPVVIPAEEAKKPQGGNRHRHERR